MFFFYFLKAFAFKVTNENLFPAVAILSSDITEALGKHLIQFQLGTNIMRYWHPKIALIFLHEGEHGPKKFIIFAHASTLWTFRL